MRDLLVYPKNMLRNLRQTGGLVFSQRILLELPKRGLSREDSYAIVQENAMRVWQDLQEAKPAQDEDSQSLFLKYLLTDDRLRAKCSEEEIKSCFDYNYYLKNTGAMFDRLFKA